MLNKLVFIKSISSEELKVFNNKIRQIKAHLYPRGGFFQYLLQKSTNLLRLYIFFEYLK